MRLARTVSWVVVRLPAQAQPGGSTITKLSTWYPYPKDGQWAQGKGNSVREAVAQLLRGRRFSRAPFRVQRSGDAEFQGAGCCIVSPADRRERGTRAHCGVAGDVVFARVPAASAMAHEAWHSGAIAVAPVGLSGRRLGPPREMAARVLSSEEEERAERALARTGCPGSRLRTRRDYVYLELRPPASS